MKGGGLGHVAEAVQGPSRQRGDLGGPGPVAGLAASEVESLMQLIRVLRADGLSIAIIEHTMHAMVKLVDRFVVLDHGEVIAEGAPEAVVKDPTVIRAYLGEKWKTDAFA